MISEVILRHRLADVIVCETIALFVEGGGARISETNSRNTGESNQPHYTPYSESHFNGRY